MTAHDSSCYRVGNECVCRDKRRERWAAMLYELANPGFRWVDLPIDAPDRAAWMEDANAAMSVADGEIASFEGRYDAVVLELARSQRENARLRAELEALTNSFNTVYLDLQDRDDMIRRVRVALGYVNQREPGYVVADIRDALQGEAL